MFRVPTACKFCGNGMTNVGERKTILGFKQHDTCTFIYSFIIGLLKAFSIA
jgi:hypothetical protein